MTHLKEQLNVGVSTPAVSHPTRNLPPSIPSTVKQIKELQISRGKAIRASIEYVVCPSTLISFICLVPRAGRQPEGGCIYPADKPIDFSSGQWRNLWSPGLEFAEKRLKNFVDVIHTGIVEIWNLNDTNGVSSHFPDFSVPHRESVFVKRPIQDMHVPRRQRSRGASSRCRVGVSHQ